MTQEPIDNRQEQEPAGISKNPAAMTQEEIDLLALSIGRNILLAQKEILTLDEASRYAGLKKSYLYKLTASRAIPHYKPNGKNCFFRRSELEAWLTSNRVATSEELDIMAQTYCLTNKSPIR